MEKTHKNSVIFFWAIMTVFFLVQNFMAIEEWTTKNIFLAIGSSVLTGLLNGFIFGLTAGWFKKSKYVDEISSIDLNDNEIIKLQTPANHVKGPEVVRGVLFLTNQRLVFKSHKINIQVHELTIPLLEIREVYKHKRLGIIDNGLTINTISNKGEKFIVEKNDEWVKYLRLPTTA